MNKKKFNGKNLKSARLLRALTLTELAKQTEISKQSLSLYENNKNTPDYERVSKLANSLNIPIDLFFLDGADFNEQTEITYFRSLSTTTKRARISQSIKLNYVSKIYSALSEYIEFPTLNLPVIEFDEYEDSSNHIEYSEMQNQIEKIAISVRNSWKLNDEPIEDMQFLLEQNGIIVTGFDTQESKIDAFSQRASFGGNDIYFIALSIGEKPAGRIRFDMAHELGHILLHPWSENLELISKNEFQLRERQANMFASALLLPKDSFIADIYQYRTDINYYLFLKKKWNTSAQAMMYRANQLNVISNNQFQYMMRQVSKQGWRKHEPDDKPFLLHENVFQGAIDLLIESKTSTVTELLKLFSNYGISLYREEIEQILGLREDSLLLKDTLPQIIQLRPKES